MSGQKKKGLMIMGLLDTINKLAQHSNFSVRNNKASHRQVQETTKKNKTHQITNHNVDMDILLNYHILAFTSSLIT